jgi:hypothetical protein
VNIYLDSRDWWVGYYRGNEHHYVCPLPTVVIRWERRAFRTWAHRRGYARILNVEHAHRTRIAYVEAVGPRWLAERLAWWAITQARWLGPFDRDSRRLRTTERTGWWRYRFHIAFTAVSR